MQPSCILLALVLVRVASSFDLDATGVSVTDKFAQFKTQFARSYTTPEAELKAFHAFAANEESIIQHNTQELSYWLGHNEFSDLTFAEFSALGYTGRSDPARRERPKNYDYSLHHHHTAVAANASFDWRTKGAVTAIKNQGNCGSCWAFSTTGALEGAYQIAGNALTSFSEQELTSCDNKAHHGGGNLGCNGGREDNAYVFISKNGLCTELDYPYSSGTTNSSGKCHINSCTPFVTLAGHKDIPSGHESNLLAAIDITPVSVNIEADTKVFQLYKGGVLDGGGCGKRIDHAVLIVGYGTQTNATTGWSIPYYIVKNSWGASWGEAGYIRIVRDKDMCGIATSPSYPTGVKNWTVPTPKPTPPPGPTPHPTPTPTPGHMKCAGDTPKWCEETFQCTGSSLLSVEQCDAFQSLYDGLHEDGVQWKSCNNRTDPCSCHAFNELIVYCRGPDIISITLTQGGLKGTISDAIGQLTSLESLELSNNPGLHGTIPNTIGDMTSLKVFTSGGDDLGAKTNGLHGSIPESIGHLNDLTVLELFHNRLTGTIPASFSKLNLNVFYIYNNLMHGRVPPMSVFKQKYCGIGDAKGTDDGNYWCKPLPADASKCNLEGAIRTRGTCSPTAAPTAPASV